MKLMSQRPLRRLITGVLVAVALVAMFSPFQEAAPAEAAPVPRAAPPEPIQDARETCVRDEGVFLWGLIWSDLTSDAVSTNDPGFGVVNMILFEPTLTFSQYSLASDTDGFYSLCIDDPELANFPVQFAITVPLGYELVAAAQGPEEIDSDFDPATQLTPLFTPVKELTSATPQFLVQFGDSIRIDAGLKRTELVTTTTTPTRLQCFGPVNVVAFLDQNGDGDPAGDPGAANVKVELIGGPFTVIPNLANFLTGADGRQQWAEICAPVGSTSIAFRFSQAGAVFTIGQDGVPFGSSGDTPDSDVDAGGLTATIAFPSGPLDVVAGLKTDAPPPPACTAEVAQTDPAGDADGDLIPNAFDPDPCVATECSAELAATVDPAGDWDGDTIPNNEDESPCDPTEQPCTPEVAVTDPEGDADNDGIPNGEDEFPCEPVPCDPEIAIADPLGDFDNDGIPNNEDPNPCVPDGPCQFEITGTVWADTNGNGQQDPGELPVAGVTVEFYSSGANAPFEVVITDANGVYSLKVPCPEGAELGTPLASSVTTVIVPPSGATGFATPNIGPDISDSDVDAKGNGPAVTTYGVFDIDGGLIMPPPPGPCSIAGVVWEDTNNDGIRQPTELLLDGISIEFRNATGAVVQSMATTGGGQYLFSRNVCTSNGYPYTIKVINGKRPITKQDVQNNSQDTVDSDVDSAGISRASHHSGDPSDRRRPRARSAAAAAVSRSVAVASAGGSAAAECCSCWASSVADCSPAGSARANRSTAATWSMAQPDPRRAAAARKHRRARSARIRPRDRRSSIRMFRRCCRARR